MLFKKKRWCHHHCHFSVKVKENQFCSCLSILRWNFYIPSKRNWDNKEEKDHLQKHIAGKCYMWCRPVESFDVHTKSACERLDLVPLRSYPLLRDIELDWALFIPPPPWSLHVGVLPVHKRVESLYLWIGEWALTGVCDYALNSNSKFRTFMEYRASILESAPKEDSVVLLKDFSAHIGDDSVPWKCVSGVGLLC